SGQEGKGQADLAAPPLGGRRPTVAGGALPDREVGAPNVGAVDQAFPGPDCQPAGLGGPGATRAGFGGVGAVASSAVLRHNPVSCKRWPPAGTLTRSPGLRLRCAVRVHHRGHLNSPPAEWGPPHSATCLLASPCPSWLVSSVNQGWRSPCPPAAQSTVAALR